jgi:hypothetical protein
MKLDASVSINFNLVFALHFEIIIEDPGRYRNGYEKPRICLSRSHHTHWQSQKWLNFQNYSKIAQKQIHYAHWK